MAKILPIFWYTTSWIHSLLAYINLFLLLWSVWLKISTVLLSLQGNLEFVDDDQEQASVVNSDENLNVISFLLGSEPRHVEKALCYRVVAAGQTEVVDKGHHAVDAAHGRDALAKVITLLLAMMSIILRSSNSCGSGLSLENRGNSYV